MLESGMFGESAKFTANTGIAQDKTANTNLDGTGTLSTIITAADSGTYVKSVTIKTTTRALQGMVRLYVYDGTNTRLLREIQIDPHAAGSGTWPTCSYPIQLNFFLKSGYILKSSVEVADTYNIIAEGYDVSYP